MVRSRKISISAPACKIAIAGIGCECLYAAYRFLSPASPAAILWDMALHAAVFLVLLGLYAWLGKDRLSGKATAALLLWAFLFQLTLLPAFPSLSDDIYRYVWDGRVQAAGINPYRFAPGDPHLAHLQTPELPRLVNHPNLKTIYPPLAQLLFLANHRLFGESVTGTKLVFSLFFLGCAWIFLRLLDLSGGDRRWLLLFAWNPLLVLETAISGHLDVAYLFFLLLGILAYYRCRPLLSGVSFAASVGMKLYSLVLLPIVLLDAVRRRKGRSFAFTFPAALTATLLLQLVPFGAQTATLLQTVRHYATYWYFNNPVFYGANAIFLDNASTHLFLFGLLFALLAVIALSPLPLQKKIFFAAAGLVVCNPTIHPWYLVALVGLSCIESHWVVIVWSGTVASSYFVIYRFRIRGRAHDTWPLLLAEYLPLLAVLIWSVVRGREREAEGKSGEE